MRLDIVIAGVGGQGTVLASRILAQAAMGAGLPTRTSETIGMAQREGTVTSHVRMGEPLHGAIIPDAGADIILGFELAETVRWLHKLKPGGIAFVNCAQVIPVSVALGSSTYDTEAINKYLREQVQNLIIFDATEIATKAGNYRATNTVLLGALSTIPELLFAPEKLLNTVLNLIPDKLKDINRQAFELGRQAVEVI